MRNEDLHRKFMELIAMDAAAKARDGVPPGRTIINVASGCHVYLGPVTINCNCRAPKSDDGTADEPAPD